MRRVISAMRDLPGAIVRRLRGVSIGTAGAALALAAVAALQVAAIHRQSLTYDAPYHLLAGYQALVRGENLLNYEHPPLVKMVAAAPLLLESDPGPAGRARPLVAMTAVTDAYARSQFVFADPERAHRIRLRSRYALLLTVVVPLLAACRALGRKLAGPRTGLVLALAVGLASATLPHLATVQTDAALALGVVLTLLAAFGYLKRPDWPRAVVLGAALGLALAVKLSGLLLLPTAAAAVALVPRPGPRLARRLLHLALALTVAFGLLEATYTLANRRYDPEHGRITIGYYTSDRATLHVADRLERWHRPLLAVERASPGLAQYLTGLLGVQAQNALGTYNTYAFGRVTHHGRWWYFPAVFLLKTPLPLLLALGAALLSLLSSLGRRRPDPPTEAPAITTPALPPLIRRRALALTVLTALVYTTAALTSTYNLGLRHLLPLLPLLWLPAAAFAARTRLRATLLVTALALESIALTPLWMSATNTWWLGRHNPSRLALGDTNLEYHQNFLALADALAERGIERVGVAMPAVTAAELDCYLPAARPVAPGDPLPPGWYALSVTVEQAAPALLAADPDDLFRPQAFQPAARAWSDLAARLRAGEDHGTAAATFHLYRLP